MDVSKNSGFSPQIIHFNRVFHFFHHPFWGFPLFMETAKYVSSMWSFEGQRRSRIQTQITGFFFKWKKAGCWVRNDPWRPWKSFFWVYIHIWNLYVSQVQQSVLWIVWFIPFVQQPAIRSEPGKPFPRWDGIPLDSSWVKGTIWRKLCLSMTSQRSVADPLDPWRRFEFHSEKDGTFPSNSDVGQYYVMVLQPTQKNMCHIMSRSQNFLEEGEEEEAIHHNVLPLNKKQFIVQNFMFLGSYHKLYMTLLFRISFRKKLKTNAAGPRWEGISIGGFRRFLCHCHPEHWERWILV